MKVAADSAFAVVRDGLARLASGIVVEAGKEGVAPL